MVQIVRMVQTCMAGTVLAVVALLTILATGQSAHAGAVDYFTETSKDFGTTPKGPVLVHSFTIRNNSKNTVTMGTPRIQCGCVSVSLQKATLAPGEETTLVAYMDTKKIPTTQLNVTKTVAVYVPFTSPVYEEVTVKVTTVARDDLFLSPDVLALGTVRKGQTPNNSVKLTMYTQANWEVKEVGSTGAFVKAESKLLRRQGNEVTYEISATLDKDCPIGNWMSEVVVSSNSPGLEKFRIPVTVNVLPVLAVSPSALKFGDVTAESTPSLQVIVQAAEPFAVKDVKSEDDVKVLTVTEGARVLHIFKVTLNSKSAGEVSRKIEIRTDSKTDPVVVVPVTANVMK